MPSRADRARRERSEPHPFGFSVGGGLGDDTDEVSRLQLENQSGFILLENGDRILLEQ